MAVDKAEQSQAMQARSISIDLRGRRLIEDLSLAIQPGKITVVIGANGAGKTTLLRALAAEIPVTEGSICINNKSLIDWNIRQLSQIRAVLPQHSQLDFPFTTREVVLMGRGPHPHNAALDQTIVDEVLALTDISALDKRRYTNLSGGEQQRVQLARVLAQIWDQAPEVERYLLLDEPVAALDLAHQYQLFDQFRQLARERNFGILATLHDLNLTARYADFVMMLKQGREYASGSVDTVLSEANIKAAYDIEVCRTSHPELNSVPVIIPR